MPDDVMATGSLLAGFAWTLWWNFDWRRYVRFYGVKNPSDHLLIAIVLRAFFASCSAGAAYQLGQTLFRKAQSFQFYWHSFLVAATIFVVIILIVWTTEWMESNRT